jgi:hypothetical protein
MVCQRMGLLDDAIREHLELKRLRGADPGLVSREESEAFGPSRGGEPADTGDDIADSEDFAEDFPNVGQETAELDMRTVLEDESDRDATSAEPDAVAPGAPGAPSSEASRERGTADDSLEWEMPGDNAFDGPDEHTEDDLPSGGSGDRPVEDVLEETPDFLRDTPEQERLWFEQRPPRDFDFDK